MTSSTMRDDFPDDEDLSPAPEIVINNHFNQLTPAEAERLAMLAEECGEVVQVIGKILRHGYASFHPNGGLNNRGLLLKEITDLIAVMSAMDEVNDVDLPAPSQTRAAWERKLLYAHHQVAAAKEPRNE